MKQARNLFVVLLISCIGFLCSSEASAAATPSFTVSVSANPAIVASPQSEALTVTTTASLAASGYTIALTVTTSGIQETSKTFSNITFKANTALTETYNWAVPSTAPAGSYTVTASVKKSTTTVASATTTFTVISNGTCGSSNGTNVTSIPTKNLCSIGTASAVSGTGPWNWTCAGVGGTTASCSANLKVNGACGPSNKQTLSSAPTTGLCTTGTPTAITGSGPWKWTCAGSNTGTTASCSASYAAPCGSTPSGQTVTTTVSTTNGSTPATTAQCPNGGTQPITTTITQLQLCTNGKLTNQGKQITTTVNNGAPLCAVSGTCGPANNVAVSSAPITDLCNSTGITPTVAGTGPWTWLCTGIYGGTTQSCLAPLFGAPVNGSCGGANGVAIASAPTANLCNSTGTTPTVTGTGPWAWTCTGTFGGTDTPCSAPLAGSNCTFANSAASQGLADGCAGAPTGTPQLPNLLSSYGTNRPTWDVAGVEYYVGVPSGVTLVDPVTGPLPAGCKATGTTSVDCSGNNITLSGFDFSLHGGMTVTISGTGNVVKNNKFGIVPNCPYAPILNFPLSANQTITIINNTFDSGGAVCAAQFEAQQSWDTALDSDLGNGAVAIIEYNYFLNTASDLLDISGPTSGSGGAVILDYNLFSGQGWAGHPDGIQLNHGNFNGVVVGFNTYYKPYGAGAGTEAGTQPFHIEAQSTSAVSNSTVAYNTMVTAGNCDGSKYPVNCQINIDIACKMDGAGNSNTGFAAYGNYIDWSGGLAALDTESGCTNATFGIPAANIDMSTGKILPPPTP